MEAKQFAFAPLSLEVIAGQTATLEFTPTKLGTYEYWCTVSGHKEAGMTGTLVVKGPSG